ncbi:phosphorylase [Sphingomonas echinoides]|uniref:Phosphorylase n=1 Tax=Sphingomonas echinoides TaxID=59803 RepID=A0ABU4PN35_9SPHN|nr:phosphorylase [Sphingomonas echinoides]MDX5985550.1 phosphorylase [Sphingomonas echinoides]
MTILVACGLTREAAIIARPGVVVVAGGGDALRLERELEAAAGGVSAVLSCGVAGALDPALRAGDVVVGTLHTPFVSSEVEKPAMVPGFSTSLETNGGLVAYLASALPNAHRGTIVGADQIIASVVEKAALYAATGAIAVDMESHIAARVAARHDLPFAILRTISDSADHALPPAALVGMKPDGGVALGAILASLARNPAQLPALIRTGRDAGAAFTALRRALSSVDLALRNWAIRSQDRP